MKDRTKYIPGIVSLLVTFVVIIVTIINEYEPIQKMVIILVVLICSYLAGLIIKWLANTYLVVEPVKPPEENSEENPEGEEGENEDSDDKVSKEETVKTENPNEDK